MSIKLLNVIVLITCLDILTNFYYKLISPMNLLLLNEFTQSTIFFYSLVVGTLAFILVLVYFILRKSWLILTMLVVCFVITNLVNYELNKLISGDEINLPLFIILSKISFLSDVILGCTIIWTERKNQGLLAWYGASIVIFNSINRIYAFSNSSSFDRIIPVLSLVPEIILLGYFFRQKAKLKTNQV